MSDEKSFDQHVEEVREEGEGGGQDDFHEKTSSQIQWGIVVGFFVVGGILGTIFNPAEPASGFLVFGFLIGGVAWALATESGRKSLEEFADIIEEMDQQQPQQQQSVSTSSTVEKNVVCSECGWKNPKSNNYCHDCGEELG
jgi:Na+-transporting NADH:ubiquinone oxidoreductase subunit NqrB